jgi:hypothetical protein
VKQNEPNIPSLIGTDGKMLDMILKRTIDFQILDLSHLSSQTTVGHLLLNLSIKSKVNAIIDTGALLAGITNHDAAEMMINSPHFDMIYRVFVISTH